MKNKNRANMFNDKRFGEYDDTLSAEDKMLMRFQKERAVSNQRGKMFQLDDDDEHTLTHDGMALGELDDYDDTVRKGAYGRTNISSDKRRAWFILPQNEAKGGRPVFGLTFERPTSGRYKDVDVPTRLKLLPGAVRRQRSARSHAVP